MKGYAQGEIEDLIGKGVEELAGDGRPLPPRHPAVQDVRGHAQKEQAKTQRKSPVEDRPNQRPHQSEPRRGQNVGPSHNLDVTHQKRENQ